MKEKIVKAFDDMQRLMKQAVTPDVYNRMENAKKIMIEDGELDKLINDNTAQVAKHGEAEFIRYVLTLLVDQAEHSFECPNCPERDTCTKFPKKIMEATV